MSYVPSRATNPILGIFIFWSACVLVLAGFLLPEPWCWVVSVAAIEPVLYGSHEALHGHFVPRGRSGRYGGRRHQEAAAIVGMAIQGMNLYLLRPAHMHHHKFGRYDDGYAPDVTPASPTLMQRMHYYIVLMGLPALLWQGAGFARMVRRPENLPFLVKIRFRDRLDAQYFIAQGLVVATLAYMLLAGGILKFLVFEVCFCFLWSVQQNIAHYGLKGVDPETDRLCARSYYLPRPFNWLTFGSTAHFLHHADMTVPAWDLYDGEPLRKAEDRVGVKVKCEYGLWPFVRDILKQFRGPVEVAGLNTSWLLATPDRPAPGKTAEFSYRRGRTWRDAAKVR